MRVHHRPWLTKKLYVPADVKGISRGWPLPLVVGSWRHPDRCVQLRSRYTRHSQCGCNPPRWKNRGGGARVKIAKNARTLDFTGTYILAGLVDGFAGLGPPKSSIVRENNVTALFANPPPVGKDGHRMELIIDNTIRAADLFLRTSGSFPSPQTLDGRLTC
jgi:hypothetical protein